MRIDDRHSDAEWAWVVDENHPVRVVRGPQAIVYFDGGPNTTDQKGEYEFWVLESDCKPFPGRYLIGHDPAVRFRQLRTDRLKHPGYEKYWQCAQSAKLIRYARKEEVEGWLRAHTADIPFATSGARIGSDHFTIEGSGKGCRLVLSPPSRAPNR